MFLGGWSKQENLNGINADTHGENAKLYTDSNPSSGLTH